MKTDKSKYLALFTLTAIVVYAILLPIVVPESATDANLANARNSPSLHNLFGTDYAGHDLMVRVALGLRVSLLIAVLCALFATVVGALVGSVAAIFGGWVDSVLMRIADVVNALPHLLLGIVIVALFRGSVLAIVVSIVATHWAQVSRIVRSEAVTIRHLEYVDASLLVGASKWYMLRRHIIPGVVGQLSVALVMLLPHAIWHESTLSFLGLGLSPDKASLGTLLQQAQTEILIGSWWTLVFPSAVLIILTFSIGAVARMLKREHSQRASRGLPI